MKIIEQSHKIIKIDENPLELIEQAARTCWRSEDKIKPGSDAQIAKTLKAKGHGAMLEFGDAMVEFVTNRGVCYDNETEVLTKEGWKFFKETNDDDEFFTTNLKTLGVEYQKRIGYTEEDWDGELIYGESTMVDFGITPNHRMLWYHYDSRKDKNWKISPAEDVYGRRVKLQRGLFKDWKGEPVPHEFSQQKTLSFAKFMGIFITDGWIYKYKDSGSQVGISQTKKFGCDYIEQVLKDLDWRFVYKNGSYTVQVPYLYKFLCKYFPEKPRKQNCRVPLWIRQAPKEYIQAFIEGVIAGDGNIHNDTGHAVIYGSNYNLMGDFQECVLKIGLSSTLRKDDRRGLEREVNGQTFKNILVGYILSITTRTNEHLFNKKHWMKRYYKGKVRCVSVPNETLYVRRNGKAFWCCNTHELVRHRVGMSYAQESTRYVKYGNDMEFILPVWMDKKHLGVWDTKRVFNMSIGVSDSDCVTFMTILGSCQRSYKNLINRAGWKPEQAREVLPNALRTKITVKGNFRAWLHMFDLRCSKKAHPQIRALMLPTLAEFHRRLPVVFEDIYSKYEEEIKS